LRELLTSSAEGSPFYMEELVKMLIDQGAITLGEQWKVDPARLLLTRVPATLTGVLQSRLDGLPPAEKRALQQASVVGAVFWDQALAALDGQAVDQLPALVRREITLPRVDAALQGLCEYAFSHQVLHQVTYDTVLRRDKRQGHAKVAQWLAGLSAQGGLREGDFMGLAAQHFELAGDEASAAEYHTRAAEQALQRLAHDRVLAHVERALVLQRQTPAPLPALRWRLLTAREKTLHTLARREQQAVDLEALSQLADAMDDDRLRSEAALRRNGLSMRTSDWDDAQRSARHAMACASRAGDEDLRLRSLRALAWALVEQGAIESGRALALDGLAQARSLGMRRVEASLLNVLSIAADMQGDLLGSLALDRQSLMANQEAGNRSGEAIARLNLGEGWMKLGDLVQARRELDAALQMFRADGDRTIEGVTLCNLSMLALWQGDETGALTLARSALAIAVGTQARDSQVLAELRQGDAELALGRQQEARQAYTRAGTLSAQLGSAYQHDAAAGLAQLAIAQGDAASAIAALHPLLEHVASGGNLDGTYEARRIELTCHQALALAGDGRADDWLSRAHAALMAQGQVLTDPALRQGFLQHIPHHRGILSAWVARPR
jgi:predicted ATPase